MPSWFPEVFKSKGLDKKYGPASFLVPAYIVSDFNGDSIPDVAVLVIERSSQKKGILLIHGNTFDTFVFGAGSAFGEGDDDFKWASRWKLYTKKKATESLLEKESGDKIGSREVKLYRPGILVERVEDDAVAAGGIIYWNDQGYIWIQQGEQSEN
ncbi:hypothetical protein SAMN05421788_106351 [Filimonas lacunae]|uniref:FG-GAP repeat-containing protein n=2 Tax=Filimonas lacunae TaxID=477680 RepID=A0A173MFD4_9BACT|nr:hypothetical protein [Filimonas lacunae]BAV06285.1 hypothetical protein FLA_2301 [Filimonas lacunae]SIT25657.1 hypothetical protein SAMN05421788_106351 [Filimonas lacunae]